MDLIKVNNMTKCKVAHVLVFQKLAGSQVVSLNILKSLPNNVFDKYIIFGGEANSEFELYFNKYNIKVLYIKSLGRNISKDDIKAFLELYSLFKKEKFDIVHTHSTKPAIIARIAAKFSGIKKIFHTVHGISFHSYEKNSKRFFYYICEIFSALFGDVNFLVNEKYKIYYPAKIINSITIHNGVDFDDFNIDKDLNKNIINVGFFARLDEQKDPITLIRALARIKALKLNNKSFHCYIAGDGEYKEQCNLLINELKLNDTISCLGWISDKSKFFNSIDILCQPSIYEAFGLNIVEAAHFSIPCVSTNVEGIPEVIIDGETGLLSKPRDINVISDNITLLINNDELRIEMGKKAKIFVDNEFTLKKMTNKYLVHYQEASKLAD